MTIFQGNYQLVWNSTSMDALKRCPREYQQSIIQGFSTGAENIHIHFGLIYHKAIEVYHFTKAKSQDHQTALRAAVRTVLQLANPAILTDSAKSKPNLVRSVVWYLENFIDDPIETLILANGEPAVEVTFAVDLGIKSATGVSLIMAGHLDRIGTFMGDRYFTDLKTTQSALGEYYFENYSPHNQMSTYSFSGQIHSNIPLKGGILDVAQIQVGGTRFERGFIHRTPDTMQEWFEDLQFWLAQADYFAKNNYWPMNDTACRMCKFKKICAMDPKVRPGYLAVLPKRIVNPLEIRT